MKKHKSRRSPDSSAPVHRLPAPGDMPGPSSNLEAARFAQVCWYGQVVGRTFSRWRALRWDCRSQSTVGVNPRGIINLRYRRAHDEIAMDRSRRSSCDQQKFWCAIPHSICRSPTNRASGVLEYSMVSRPTPQCLGGVGTGANRVGSSRHSPDQCRPDRNGRGA